MLGPCHYCSEPADRRVTTYVDNGRLRRWLTGFTRRVVYVETCIVHQATPIAGLLGMYSPARRAFLNEWKREEER